MGIAVLGPLLVNGGAHGLAPRDRVVLETLAIRPKDVVTAEQIAEALWPETPPATWSKVVQGSVVRLRKVLGTGVIETVDHGYRLTVPRSDLDSLEFERLVSRAREQLTLGEPERATYTLDAALGLWRGRPLADLEEWEPGRREAERLEELRRDAEELRLEAALGTGRHREVLTEARKCVEDAPLRERRWELLALAQYRSGRQADALRTLHQVKNVLLNELGLDPGPDLVALEQAILRQESSLLADTAPVEPSVTCPYLGLVPYDVADTEAFFGRDADIAACLGRLADSGVLAVVGPSGSGKSSLVRAGLAAAVRRDGRRVVVITPGPHPMDALTAVPSTGSPVVLVVDQCEEAVSLCEDHDEQTRFFAALTTHAETAPLVIALRADRFGDLAAHADFARLVEKGLYLLNPMSTESLRSAIEGPAKQAGLRLEPGLVELLVREVEGEPGALPHLSHALRQTWERREGSVLTLEGYQATGGIRNAVAQSAEDLYDDMTAEQRAMLRDLMLRLVSPSPEGEAVRSRIPRRLLSVDAEHDRLMEQLVSARLVTSDDGVVELAHEALARAWPRLRGWLDEDTEGQLILRHLAVAADTWDGMGRPDSELYRGTRLAQALEWRAASQPDLTPTERAFLDEGKRLAEKEEQTAAQQARYQARVNRRLRGLLAGAAFLLIVGLVAGTLAVRQANRADEAATAADARRVAAQSQLTDRIDRSLQLAVAAHAVESSAESRAGLLAALARSPQLTSFVPAVDLPFWRMDISPDGGQVAVMDAANHIWFYDAESLELLGDYDPFPEAWDMEIGGSSDPIAYSPAGDLMAIGILNLRGDAVRLIDAQTYRPLEDQPGGFPSNSYTNDVDLSPDGRFLASTMAIVPEGFRYVALVWDLEQPDRPLYEIDLEGDTWYTEFSADGERLYVLPGYSTDEPPVVQVFDMATGRAVGDLGELGHPFEVSPDGSTYAHAKGNDVVIADSNGQEIHRLRGPQEPNRRIHFSPDGGLVAAASEDGTVMVWNTTDGTMLERLPLGSTLWFDARLDHDGRRVFATTDSGLMVFDIRGDERYVQKVTPLDEPRLAWDATTRYPSPDGATVAVNTWDPEIEDGRLSFVESANGRSTPAESNGWVGDNEDDHSWTPDGGRLALLDRQARLQILDAGTGELLAERQFDGAGIVEYDETGERILVDADGGVMLLDAETLESLTDPVGLSGQRSELVVLGPDEDTAVFVTTLELGGDFDWFGAARQWSHVDLENGEVIRQGTLQHSAKSAALSPDGNRLALGSVEGLEIVEVATGRTLRSVDTMAGHETEGRHVTWSGDGALVATNDGSGRVSLWDGRTSALLGTIQPGDRNSASVFLEDNRTLRIFSWDGAVYEWNTSMDHAVEFACGIVGRGLNEAEWLAAFGGREYQEVC
ncbi:MAG TPA: BTAD domain-containing putative transcriptional regulator [Nocardioidaceae bacterium]|nr:BTAD domain-containing putative transcriptional regulator [Nocardioidaceae bacterium]